MADVVERLLPCPFCGGTNIDPEGWVSTERKGPACDDCAGCADTVELWNSRPLSQAGAGGGAVAPPCAATEARMPKLAEGGTYIGKPKGWKWMESMRVRKTKGSSWQGPIVGYYSTVLTPVGYCVESEREPGSVQIYPESALELVPEDQLHD
jgi:hypothetical protein